jgi:hypothetical protein
MPDNHPSAGRFGLILGAIVVAGALLFIATGGELGGKKTIEHDSDLPAAFADQR